MTYSVPVAPLRTTALRMIVILLMRMSSAQAHIRTVRLGGIEQDRLHQMLGRCTCSTGWRFHSPSGVRCPHPSSSSRDSWPAKLVA